MYILVNNTERTKPLQFHSRTKKNLSEFNSIFSCDKMCITQVISFTVKLQYMCTARIHHNDCSLFLT